MRMFQKTELMMTWGLGVIVLVAASYFVAQQTGFLWADEVDPEAVEVTGDVNTSMVTSDDPVTIASFRYMGGSNPCHYLFAPTTLGTIADFAIVLELIAETTQRHEDNLVARDAYQMMGQNGPHTFTLIDSQGQEVLSVPVGEGETVRQVIRLDRGHYEIHEPGLGQIGVLSARSPEQPGYSPVTQFHYDCGMAQLPDMEEADE